MSRLMTTTETAELLRMSPENLRDLVAEGRIRASRLRPRGKLLFAEADVQAALQQARGDAGTAGGTDGQ